MDPEMKQNLQIGLALGAGGARGLAHIPVLELFDELKIVPACIAGSSIGAVIGALYASGLSGVDIRRQVASVIASESKTVFDAVRDKNFLNWLDVFIPSLGHGGVFNANRVTEHLKDMLPFKTFDELAIPMKIVATDCRTGEAVVFDSGDILPAIEGSLAIPGVFSPVPFEDRLLIDGGISNPVPYDVLPDTCDFIVAIESIGKLSLIDDETPRMAHVIQDSFRMLQMRVESEKRRNVPPDIYLKTGIAGVHVLDFGKADEVYRQAAPAVRELRNRLLQHMQIKSGV